MIKRISFTILVVSSIFLISCSNLNNNKYIESTEKIEHSKLNIDKFKDIYTEQNNNKAIKLYENFLKGNITIEGVDISYLTIPTGEPNRRYPTKYSYFDSSGDGVPELHVKSSKYYYILTVSNNELQIWKNLTDQYYVALNNGAFLKYYPINAFNKIEYDFIIFDFMGDEIWKLNFYKTGDEEYFFSDVEVTKDQWNMLTDQFFYIDNKGVLQIKNEIQWTVLYE